MKEIPRVDIREAGSPALLEQFQDSARALIAASRTSFGRLPHLASYAGAPVADWLARRWLEKTGNPYLSEIDTLARCLRIPGIYALNLAYEFGCTSGVYTTESGPTLLRVLDWPFRKLGLHTLVARQKGVAGEFHNVTWPGVSGVFHALAEGRFAVALNQAPMRRHRIGGLFFDWAKNRRMVWKAHALPPAHLLRHVCETARNYEEAKDMLLREPIAIPGIFILAGIHSAEGCVIERLEETAALREIVSQPHVYASNHFLSHLNGIGYGWRPRETNSCMRAVCAGLITGRQAEDPAMGWFKPPIANLNSRLCLRMSPATGALSALGTEGEAPVTELFRL